MTRDAPPPAPAHRRRRAGSVHRYPIPSRPDDPERRVVDVPAAVADVVKRPDAGLDRVRDPRARSANAVVNPTALEERALAAGIGEVALVQAADALATGYPGRSRAHDQLLDLPRLGDPHRQHELRVEHARDRRARARPRRSAPSSDTPSRFRAPQIGVADRGDDRGRDQDPDGDHRRLAALQAAVEADPQPAQLQRRSSRRWRRRCRSPAGDPQRLVERDADDHVDDHVHRRQLGRDPRPLEREERPRQQQVDAARTEG